MLAPNIKLKPESLERYASRPNPNYQGPKRVGRISHPFFYLNESEDLLAQYLPFDTKNNGPYRGRDY